MIAKLAGGPNVAMKLPPHLHEATVRFCCDVVGLKPLDSPAAIVHLVSRRRG